MSIDLMIPQSLKKLMPSMPELPVSIADDPLCCVVLGTGKMLDDFKLLRKLFIESMAA